MPHIEMTGKGGAKGFFEAFGAGIVLVLVVLLVQAAGCCYECGRRIKNVFRNPFS